MTGIPGIAYHRDRTPKPVANTADADAAERTLRAIREIRRARGCLAYLYVLPGGDVYVISDDRPSAGAWMLEHVECWRGCYTVGVTLEDVAFDLT